MDLQSQASPHLELSLQRVGLVPVARHQQRPAGQIAGIGARGLAQLLDKRGVRGRGGETQIEHGALDWAGLGDRGEHPGRDRGRTPAERVALQHGDTQATLRRAPGDGQTNRAAPGDGHVK